MTATFTPDSTLVHRANLNIAAAVMAKSGPRVPDSLIGRAIDEIRASHPVAELAESGNMPMVVAAVETFLARHHEADRPRNLHGAEAARAAQAAGAEGTRGGAGFGTIDAIRASSSARYRELASDSAKGTGSSGASGGSGGAVSAEFARSFADTGIGGGTLKTFAEVGLDRGIFNQFRNEGFSAAQIKDSAEDSQKLGWKGKEDLAIAQHATPEARKASVATEQAKTPEERAKRLEREHELERQNEQRPDSDPRKQHDRRFWQRRHQDHLRHDAKAGLGSAWSEPGKAISAAHASQDGTMAKAVKKSVASLTSKDTDDFGTSATPAPTPNKPAPVRTATAKPTAPAVG